MTDPDPLQLSFAVAGGGVGSGSGAISGSDSDSSTDELGLGETTFVVVDLETTGMRAGDDHIIEIGAVRVRGGVEEGRFS